MVCGGGIEFGKRGRSVREFVGRVYGQLAVELVSEASRVSQLRKQQ